MAKKRSGKSSRKVPTAAPATTEDAVTATDNGAHVPDDAATCTATTTELAPQSVSLKDLADASAEDVARASFNAPVAVLSPRHDELADDAIPSTTSNINSTTNDLLQQADDLAAASTTAETVLSWKLARNGAVVSPLLASPTPIATNDSVPQQQPPQPIATTSDAATRSAFALDHIPGVQHVGSDHENYKSDENDDAHDPQQSLSRVVPNIKTYDLHTASASNGFLGQYIDEQAAQSRRASSHRGSHHSLSNVFGSATSPCSSLVGLGNPNASIPHSKSLIIDDQHAALVLQSIPNSRVEVVEVVAEQSWLITKLTVQLLWALRMSQRWMLCALRLTWFVLLLFLPLVRMTIYYIRDANVHKNIIYGLHGRNLLDVYAVPGSNAPNDPLNDPQSTHTTSKQHQPPLRKYPVVVFFTGGAWIIGYKAWGSLIGKVLSACGIVVVTPDYRNFPQGIAPDMVDDATRAMQWVFDNIHLFCGDPENVTIVGQSAGAHIAVCSMLELVEQHEQTLLRRRRESTVAPSPTFSTCSRHSQVSNVESQFTIRPSWSLQQVRSFIGISGPYNIEVAVETFHRHGFDKNVVERIMDHQLAYYSPALRLLAKSELPNVQRVLEHFPPVYLFHGTSDKTVSWRSTEQFAAALTACSVPVTARYFDGKSHTDPIIEDPILGDDFLLDEIQKIIRQCAPRSQDDCTSEAQRVEKVDDDDDAFVSSAMAAASKKRYYPLFLVQAARKMNPF